VSDSHRRPRFSRAPYCRGGWDRLPWHCGPGAVWRVWAAAPGGATVVELVRASLAELEAPGGRAAVAAGLLAARRRARALAGGRP